MSEKPIKLFANRAERYPEPNETDTAHYGREAVLSAIPFVGGPASELFAFLIAPTLSRRRDEWFKELADAIEKLGPKCGIWVVIRAQNQLALSKEKSVASCPADACGKEFAFEFRETRVFEVLLSLFERRYFYRSELQASGT